MKNVSVPLLLLSLLGACAVHGQEKARQTQLDNLAYPIPEKTEAAQTGVIALESTVDPAHYFVGPSDLISVNIWMSPPLNLPLTVTPEGTLIIPTVGEVAVANLTLAAAKEKIIAAARKKYLSVEITATLVKPRPIVVSVSGNVLNPGLYTLNAVDRANKAIDEANKPGRTQTVGDVDPILQIMSKRNIILTHRDGTQDRVDIVKYFATHEDKWNPYLREGDVIVVPRNNEYKNVFGVYGQVNSPGRFEFVEGDSVLGAIRIANGLTVLAIPESTIFSRINADGTELANRTINLTEIKAGRAPDIALQPGDRIVVKGRNDEREDYNVDVKGEVLHPATYPITKNRTHLSEIIREAGGFTDFASLGNAQVIRQTYGPEDANRERLMSMRGGIATEDSAGFALETELRVTQEAVNVDFVRLFDQKDTTQDIILQAEDEIIVPSQHQTVYVFGQVGLPGHVAYVSGKDPDYYVKKAGGFTDRANTGGLRIIKARTKQWVEPGETTLDPGDYIWVPTAPDHPFSYYITSLSQAATILSVVIGVAVVIIQLRK